MNIKKKKDGSTLTVAISGRIDTVTAPEADASINESLDGVQSLIIDFTEVNYVSSAGLRMLLSLQKKMMTRLTRIVTIMLMKSRRFWKAIPILMKSRIMKLMKKKARRTRTIPTVT